MHYKRPSVLLLCRMVNNEIKFKLLCKNQEIIQDCFKFMKKEPRKVVAYFEQFIKPTQ